MVTKKVLCMLMADEKVEVFTIHVVVPLEVFLIFILCIFIIFLLSLCALINI
jgi:hypothetical protein